MRLVNPQVAKDLQQGRPIRIDLGGGPRPRPGFYALDQLELEGIDIVADLNRPLDLLPDNCSDHVFSSHTLEHVRELLPLLAEIHRITRPGGLVEIVVPHFSNPYYYYSDPTHVRFFGLYTMNYFVDPDRQPRAWRVPAFYSATRFELESVKLSFYRTSLLDRLFVPLLRYLVNRSPGAQNFYERRPCWLLPAAEVRYRMRALQGALTPLQRVLIAYTSRPPTIDYLKAAFARRGIEAKGLYADENTWVDRFVFRRFNKLAHNFGVLPKSRNFFEDHPSSHMNYRSSRLRAEIAAYEPDLVFLIRGLGFRSWATEGARTKLGWWVEADERVDEALGELPWFDGYFFINASSVEAARRAGHRHVHYLPHAVDPSVFRPLPGVTKDIDFSFVGLWSKKRQRFIEAALEVSPNAAVYGPKWYAKTFRDRRFRRIVKGRYIAGEPLVRLYNRSKVVINVTNWGGGDGAKRSGMTMRLFEVPAAGGPSADRPLARDRARRYPGRARGDVLRPGGLPAKAALVPGECARARPDCSSRHGARDRALHL